MEEKKMSLTQKYPTNRLEAVNQFLDVLSGWEYQEQLSALVSDEVKSLKKLATELIEEYEHERDLPKCVQCQRPTKKKDWGFQSSMTNDDGTTTNIVTCKSCVDKDTKQKEVSSHSSTH